MSRVSLFLAVTLCLAVAGCSKDAEIDSSLSQLDTLTRELVKMISAGDIDGAKALCDSKKGMLKA